MRKFITIIFLLIKCSSSSVEDVKYFPPKNFGCSEYIGRDRINCINMLLSELENIKNSSPTIKEISKKRKNDSVVVIKKEICHGTLCFETEQEIYDPSFWSELKKFLLISLPSIGLGILISTI